MTGSRAPSVLIIGGGPAGLAAGIYARKAGLRPIVLEQHDLPGGLCTAWDRKGYTIDGCLHILMGSGPGSPFHGMFRELGLFEEVDPYARWKRWKDQGREVYLEQKRQAAATVLEALDRHFPGFGDSVEMTDVATPLTFHRYTANQEGSLIAWDALPETPMTLDKTVAGIERLYLAGHWVMPGGGVPQAVMSGRQAIQAICMDEKIRVDWTLPA